MYKELTERNFSKVEEVLEINEQIKQFMKRYEIATYIHDKEYLKREIALLIIRLQNL